MFKMINRHPFVSGFITGFIGIGVVGRGIKKFLKGKITIIQIDLNSAEEKKPDPTVNKDPSED